MLDITWIDCARAAVIAGTLGACFASGIILFYCALILVRAAGGWIMAKFGGAR